ncbi:MAG TPA: ABC transporter permease subunit [Myxococcota bacterium]
MNSLTTILAIARDVLREAASSKLLLVLFTVIGLFLLALTFSLNLEVVDGALAGAKIFGNDNSGGIVPVDVFLRPVFSALAWVTFYFGLVFGIVATADITPKALQPGRVEHLLALPVRRTELVVGLYVGVCAICLIMTSVAVGGVSLVLFIKAEMFTVAPIAGAAMACIAFAAIYAVMLAVGALARSAALSAGAGLATFVAGIVVGHKQDWLNWLESPTRQIADVVTMPLPNLKALADVGAAAASGAPLEAATIAPVIAATLAFAVVGVAVAAAVVSTRDY